MIFLNFTSPAPHPFSICPILPLPRCSRCLFTRSTITYLHTYIPRTACLFYLPRHLLSSSILAGFVAQKALRLIGLYFLPKLRENVGVLVPPSLIPPPSPCPISF